MDNKSAGAVYVLVNVCVCARACVHFATIAFYNKMLMFWKVQRHKNYSIARNDSKHWLDCCIGLGWVLFCRGIWLKSYSNAHIDIRIHWFLIVYTRCTDVSIHHFLLHTKTNNMPFSWRHKLHGFIDETAKYTQKLYHTFNCIVLILIFNSK